MDAARADALSARSRLVTGHWIGRNAESFRHLLPPPAEVWLGDTAPKPAPACDASPLAGAGWTLHRVGSLPAGWTPRTPPSAPNSSPGCPRPT
jgi:Fe-S cluster assembly protein SufD